MKKIITPVLLILVMSFNVSDMKLTEAERKLAKDELTNSKKHLLNALKGLSEAQLNYKADSESWSIAECVEHIAISEDTFSGMLQELLSVVENPDRKDNIKVTDMELIAMMKDRSNKVKTQKPFEPTGKYGSHDATLKAFLKKRKENIKFIAESDADFRNRVQDFPFGSVDAFQVVLFMAAHSERHVLQIEEIKAGEGFPKS